MLKLKIPPRWRIRPRRRNALKAIAASIAGIAISPRARAQDNTKGFIPPVIDLLQDNIKGFLPPVIDLLHECPFLPLGDYVTQISEDACSQGWATSNAPVELSYLGGSIYQLSDMDIAYFNGDYVVPGNFTLGEDCETLTLVPTPGTPYNIQWVGMGQYIKDGGINGKGRLAFNCYYDATYAGSNFPESIWFDKV